MASRLPQETPVRSPALLAVRALAASRKKPGFVRRLPKRGRARHGVTIERDAVARYAALCGFADRMGVPLLYPQLLSFDLAMDWITSDDCPWPALGTVHLANRVVQLAPLAIGDRVDVLLQPGALFSHDKGQALNLDLRIERGGQTVWTATQTLLRVGAPATGEAWPGAVGTLPGLSRQADLDAPADTGRRYAAVSGDYNPIHLSALSARLFGFRRAIAHGMWTQARALSLLLPPGGVNAAEVAVDFKAPLLLPGRASLWSRRSAGGADFEVRDARGEKPHLRGQWRLLP